VAGTVTPLAAFRQALGESRVLYARGLRSSSDTSRDGFAAAVEAARAADVVLLFLGEEASLSGEASSRAYLNLPGLQEDLATEVAKVGKPTVAVILAGRPTTFHDVAGKMKAVLYAWHPGAMGGPAIAGVILGDAVPSGKLAITFPRTVGQVPIYYNHLNTGRPPSESGAAAQDKYRSKYLDVSFTPEYPFGYGLSYSKFEYSGAKVSAPQMKLGGKLAFSADVTNAGGVEADEIVQFYTHQLAGSVARPVRELKGFQRIHLKPGEKRTVTFTVTTDDLASYNPQMKLAAEPGAFEAWIAPDSASGQKMDFAVAP
jgi:beta-glucosidase